MVETVTIPGGVLSTLSFMSEILGDYDTYSKCRAMDGMITWGGKRMFEEEECFFASLCWDGEARYVEIADGVEPADHVRTGRNAAYTIFGYCRYQGIYHRLLGAPLPIFKEWNDAKTD
jgi:hypothetical protein